MLSAAHPHFFEENPMGLWHNANAETMNFQIAGNRYQVPSGGAVQIPGHLEYVIRSSGLQLTRGPSPAGKTAPEAIVEALRPNGRAVTDATVSGPGRRQHLRAVDDDDDGAASDDLEGLRSDGTFAGAVDADAAGADGEGGDESPAAGADAVDATARRLAKAGARLPKPRNA